MDDSLKIAKALEDFRMDGWEIEEDDIITDVVVLVRAQKLNTTDDVLVIASSVNTGGIVCHGILTSAVLQHEMWMTEGDD